MQRQRVWWLALLGLLLPVGFFFVSAIVTLLAVNNLDVAYALGVSNAVANGIPVVAGGLLAGLVAGLLFGLRDWRLVVPAVATCLVGLGVYWMFVASGLRTEADEVPFWVVWLAMSLAVVASTWITVSTTATRGEEKQPKPPTPSRGPLRWAMRGAIPGAVVITAGVGCMIAEVEMAATLGIYGIQLAVIGSILGAILGSIIRR